VPRSNCPLSSSLSDAIGNRQRTISDRQAVVEIREATVVNNDNELKPFVSVEFWTHCDNSQKEGWMW